MTSDKRRLLLIVCDDKKTIKIISFDFDKKKTIKQIDNQDIIRQSLFD